MILEKDTMESKKYVVVKNHVREIVDNENEGVAEETAETDKQKTSKKSKKAKKEQTSAAEDENVSDIKEKDLEQLLSAYNSCKAIISKIETKYGHLLNLNSNDEETEYDASRKRKYRYNQCYCTPQKRYRYDEGGSQYYNNRYSGQWGYKQYNNYDTSYNRQSNYDSSYNYYNHKSHVQVEDESSYDLPNSLCELGDLLKDPSIHRSYRYRIIQQMKYMRREYSSLMKYDKRFMIEQLKLNPDEYFEFKGSNLSTLEGYPA